MNWKEMLKQAAALVQKAQARQEMLDESSDMSDDERSKQADKITDLLDQADKLKQQAEEAKAAEQAAEARRQRLQQAQADMDTVVSPVQVTPGEPIAPNPTTNPAARQDAPLSQRIVVPATARRYGRLRHLGNEASAYSFGMWAMACQGHNGAQAWCHNHGISLRRDRSGPPINQDGVEGINASGGFLVPDQFENDIIDLREMYGVFRRNAKIRPMTSDKRSDPRRTGGVTAYFVGENSAGTKSTKTWDNVELSAKKLMVLSVFSNELNEDAVINYGDDIAGEIAYAYSLKEDQCGFLGDGTSTYGGIRGICWKFEQDSSLAGHLTPGSGDDTFAELALADFTQMIGALPVYALRNAKWYISNYGFGASMANIMFAAGGNNTDSMSGRAALSFLGYPVEIVQVMVGSGDQTGKAMALFGDLSLSSSMGDRRGTTVDFSADATVDGNSVFERDAIAVRGTERFDINNHDIGDSTDAGPVVALIGAT